jgi:hypothetical protein
MSNQLDPPSEVTVTVFDQWRDARRGVTAAEDLSNPYWSWLIRSETSSWAANGHFDGSSSYGGNPMWSNERYGQSSTLLDDGRTLLIAGEHEDHYDPDFFIYNDVIEIDCDGEIRILGFPTEAFPPTDFHTATMVGGKLVLIGNLGYPEQRIVGKSQILVMDPETWEIRQQASSGDGPGWIHGHQAVLDEGGSIRVSGGKVWISGEVGLVENFDDWRLDTKCWIWERLTRREVIVLEFFRGDGEPNRLFEMGMWVFNQDYYLPSIDEIAKHSGLGIDVEISEGVSESMRGVAPLDRMAFERRFRPDVLEHRVVPQPDDVFKEEIEVDGVLVRYEEEIYVVRLTVDGSLMPAKVEALREDLKGKLEKISGQVYEVRQVLP